MNFYLQRGKEVWRYRGMIFSLVRRELRGRYKRSFLGFAWTFLNPLMQLLVYTIVFSSILRVGVKNYPLFLFVIAARRSSSFHIRWISEWRAAVDGPPEQTHAAYQAYMAARKGEGV